MYDLILRGGRVIDPAQERDGVFDVALAGGRVAVVEPKLPRGQAAREIDCAGKIVTPGLIDMHAHGYWGATMIGIQPDPLCSRTGVTTFVDTGSAGADNFLGFRHYVIERSRVRVVPLLHVCSIGLINQGVGELLDNRYVNIERAVKTVEAHRDLIAGVKIRLGEWISGTNTEAGFAAACTVRDAVGLPLMVHAVGQPVPLGYVLDRLKPGDILTHCFNGLVNGILCLEREQGSVIPEAWVARDRGVLFDVGHGLGSFSWEVARRAVEQGFLPDTIGTDVYSMNINGPVYDLPTTMTKFLALGVPLPEVIRRVTANAAKALAHHPRTAGIGSLAPGAIADVAVLQIEEGAFRLTDSQKQTLTTNRRLVARLTIQGGDLVSEK